MHKNCSLIIKCTANDILNIDILRFNDYNKIYFCTDNNIQNIIDQIDTQYYSIWDYDENYKNIYNLNIYYTQPQNIDISILIPVYNCEKYIKECLDSCLKQDFNGNYEIIIVDDGSTDNTVSLIKKYSDKRINLYQKEHSGISDTLNYGLSKCNGEYICRMDGDDLMYKDRLSYQYKYMKLHPNCDMVCSGCDCLNTNNEIYEEIGYNVNNISINDFLKKHNFILHNTVFIRSSSLIKIAIDNSFIYDKEYDGSEDFELWCRMVNQYKLTINSTKEKVVIYRVFDNQQRYKSRQLLDNKILSKYINYLSNKTIGIYYIVTSVYKDSFKDFLYSLKYFFPNNKRTIILLSDGLEEYKTYHKDNIDVDYHYINDFPWPIITLFKMKYILDYKGDYDYVFYFNANSVILESNNYSWFAYDKLTLTIHHSWDLVGKNPEKLLYPFFDNPNSTSYIGNKNYTYVQGGFFGGPSNLVYSMCSEVVNMLTIDLQNCVIPKYHDETYLNKYVYQHNTYNTFNIQHIFIGQHNASLPKYGTEFIHLTYNIGNELNKKNKSYNVIPNQYLTPLYVEKNYTYENHIEQITPKSNKSVFIIPLKFKYDNIIFKFDDIDIIYTDDLTSVNQYDYKFYYILDSPHNIDLITKLYNNTINCDLLSDDIYKHNIDEFLINQITIEHNIFNYKYLYKYHIYSSYNMKLSTTAFNYIHQAISSKIICNSNMKYYYIPTLLYDAGLSIKSISNNCSIDFKIID